MPVTNIPDDHHVVRHCKKKLLIKEGDKIVGVYPELFHLRAATKDGDREEYLSAIYFEHFGETQDRLKHCCTALPLSAKPRDALVRLQAGLVRQQGKKQERRLRVTHEPSKVCESYSAIRGMPFPADDLLCSLLATAAVVDIVEVSTL